MEIDAETRPRTRTEAIVASAWSQFLGLPEIDRADDFFEVGGHSLTGMQIVSYLEEKLGVALPLAALFDHPSLSEFAAAIDRVLTQEGVSI